LMYEYDTYSDARKVFPKVRELQALDGDYFFIKNDILAGTMTFSSSKDSLSNLITLPIERVKEIMALNRQGKKVEQLIDESLMEEVDEEPTYRSEEDSITRFDNKRKKRKRGGKGQNSLQKGGDKASVQEPTKEHNEAKRDNPNEKPKQESEGAEAKGGEQNSRNENNRHNNQHRRQNRHNNRRNRASNGERRESNSENKQ
ncbi:MAG: hypothetical protein UHY58_02855, partial [Alistipes sp.]|nr:hypothetical protein [Alistipes sp.]